MVNTVFDIISQAITGVLGFFDSLFNATGMWSYVMVALLFYFLVMHILVPMLSGSGSKAGRKQDGGSSNE